MNVRDHVVKEVKRLDRGMFSVINCNFDGCGNFIVRSSHTGDCFYYDDIDGKSCAECDKIYYCEKHTYNFPIVFKDRDDELCFCCINCLEKEKQKDFVFNCCFNDPTLVRLK